MTLRTRVLLWLLPALAVLAVGQVWLLNSLVTRDTGAVNNMTVAQSSNNPAGQIAVPISRPTQEFNNSAPPPMPVTADALKPNSSAAKPQNQTSLAKPNSSDAGVSAGSSSKVSIPSAAPIKPVTPPEPVVTQPTTRAEQVKPAMQPRPVTTPTAPVAQSKPVVQPSPPTTPTATTPAALEPKTSSGETSAQPMDDKADQFSELKQLSKNATVLVRQRNGNLEFESISNPNNWILLASVGLLILALLFFRRLTLFSIFRYIK